MCRSFRRARRVPSGWNRADRQSDWHRGETPGNTAVASSGPTAAGTRVPDRSAASHSPSGRDRPAGNRQALTERWCRTVARSAGRRRVLGPFHCCRRALCLRSQSWTVVPAHSIHPPVLPARCGDPSRCDRHWQLRLVVRRTGLFVKFSCESQWVNCLDGPRCRNIPLHGHRRKCKTGPSPGQDSAAAKEK